MISWRKFLTKLISFFVLNLNLSRKFVKADYPAEINKIIEKKLKNRFIKRNNDIVLKRRNPEKMNLNMVNQIDYPGWITGFTDGEGCFSISFSKRTKSSVGVEVQPSFSVGQKAHSRESLEKIQSYLKCGSIRYSKKDGLYKYEIRNLTDLVDKVIPFFEKYPLETAKQKSFETFSQICRSIKQGHHLNSTGITEIIDKSYDMNLSGKRKVTREELIREIKNKTKKS